MRRSTVLSLPLQLVFPAITIDYRLLLSAPGAAQWSEKRYKAITIYYKLLLSDPGTAQWSEKRYRVCSKYMTN